MSNPKITDEMIKAGVFALQWRGFGNDGEPIDLLRSAVAAVFAAMAASQMDRDISRGYAERPDGSRIPLSE